MMQLMEVADAIDPAVDDFDNDVDDYDEGVSRRIEKTNRPKIERESKRSTTKLWVPVSGGNVIVYQSCGRAKKSYYSAIPKLTGQQCALTLNASIDLGTGLIRWMDGLTNKTTSKHPKECSV